MRKLFIITALLLVTGLSFSQSLQKDGVVSIHVWTVKLNPDVTMNQFLEIWDNTFSALIKEVMPEMKPLVIKGIGKDYKYEYAGLYIWESIDEFRKYWNEDGSPTEKGMPVVEKLMSKMGVLEKYGEFTYTAKDYIIIQ